MNLAFPFKTASGEELIAVEKRLDLALGNVLKTEDGTEYVQEGETLVYRPLGKNEAETAKVLADPAAMEAPDGEVA